LTEKNRILAQFDEDQIQAIEDENAELQRDKSNRIINLYEDKLSKEVEKLKE
jgi:hypothetical protein